MSTSSDGWRASAKCRTRNDVDFFPRSGDRTAFDRARRVCDACPVQAACLQYANANEIGYGIWGGLDTTAREAIAGKKFRRFGTWLEANDS